MKLRIARRVYCFDARSIDSCDGAETLSWSSVFSCWVTAALYCSTRNSTRPIKLAAFNNNWRKLCTAQRQYRRGSRSACRSDPGGSVGENRNTLGSVLRQ